MLTSRTIPREGQPTLQLLTFHRTSNFTRGFDRIVLNTAHPAERPALSTFAQGELSASQHSLYLIVIFISIYHSKCGIRLKNFQTVEVFLFKSFALLFHILTSNFSSLAKRESTAWRSCTETNGPLRQMIQVKVRRRP
jgi:hypothetical protein